MTAAAEPMAMPMHPTVKVSDRVLFDSLVAMGGGPEDFHAAVLRRRLQGSPAEAAQLTKEVGAGMIHRFDTIFTKVIDFEISHHHPASGHPLISKPAALISALYKDGLLMGTFNIEHLYDRLFSSKGHAMAMSYVATNYGAVNQRAWHKVFAQLITDRVAE